MKPHTHLPECDEVIHRAKKGDSISAIALALRITLGRVISILKTHNIVRKPKSLRVPISAIPEIVRLRAEKKTLAEIGDRFGVTREFIRQCLINAGVRPTGHRRHLCNPICVLLKKEKYSFSRIARELNIPLSRVVYSAGVHDIRATVSDVTKLRHICTDHCKRIEVFFASGFSVRATARAVGHLSTSTLYRHRSIHPQWKWPHKEWWLRSERSMKMKT